LFKGKFQEFIKKIKLINWHEKRKNFLTVLRTLFLLLLEAMIIVTVTQVLQLGTTDAGLIWVIQHKRIFMVTSLALFSLGVGLCALIGRYWIANTIFITIGTVFAFANQQKKIARAETLLPSDLIFIKEPSEMLKMADHSALVKILVGIIFLIILTIVLEKFVPIKWKNLKRFWVLRIIIVCLIILGASSISDITKKGTAINNLSNWMGNRLEFWDSNAIANENGPWLTFANFLGSSIMDEPQGYNKSNMQQIAFKYKKESKLINKNRKNKDINQQTLIYVLSESYSDPKRVPNMQVNKNPVPEIDKLKKNNTSGLMLSSGYGGGTANIEYGVDTSWNLQLFDSSMTTPFTQVVMKNKYNSSVAELFKRKNAIHPFVGTFYQRREAYDRFGFQTFRTTDGKEKNEKLKYQKKIQKSDLVGDDQAYKNVIWQLNKEKRGQFINLITMQNHMPFTDKYEEYPYTASGSAVANPQNAEQVKHYMQGISLTSQYTQKFINKLDKYKRPITVVWYGDHLPGIYGGDDMNNYYVPLHETDYFIYSNKYARKNGYSVGKQTDHTQVVSPSSFTALSLKQMDQKVSPFYALMTKVTEQLPAQSRGNNDTSGGLLVDDKNKTLSQKDLSKKQRDLLHDYRLVQYDNTAGKHYLKNMNFMK